MTEMSPENRMQAYLQKIAAGPKLSKDLSEEEAEDALSLILDGEVSEVRMGVFLIAARMKVETVPENIGYWRALQNRMARKKIALDSLLQIADPFDGFQRIPYFGFFAIPVIAELGLPTYGHSALPLPPKFGITFEDLVVNHYQLPKSGNSEQRIKQIEKFKFGYLSTADTHPALESLRSMRTEIVKRPMLATLEKILMPLQADSKNFLATTYFHRGYEVSLTEIGKRSPFDRVIVGNGMEGTTLFGVHKEAKVFIQNGDSEAQPRTLKYSEMYQKKTAKQIIESHEALKEIESKRETITDMGESALKTGKGPAAIQIASQAACLTNLSDIFKTPQEGFDAALKVLQTGVCYEKLMQWMKL
ncbi:MAG: anthranilate phosphoribosyltransferase [Nitrospinales bacterium]|jgi:anthranilate phosphoribosyltransferase